MSLAEFCRSSFRSVALEGGQVLHLCGHVKLEDHGADPCRVDAQVGSRSERDAEQVFLAWEGSIENGIKASCTCDDFRRGNFCRHIWATILKVEETWKPDGIPAENRGRTTGLDTARTVWRERLKRLSRQSSARKTPISLKVSHSREVWYVIDVGVTQMRGDLTVRMHQREKSSAGKWGKIKRLKANADRIHEFSLEEDRRLLELLLGGAEHEEKYRYYSQTYSPSVSTVRVPQSLYPIVLPEMCRTGRCLWSLDGDPATRDAEEPLQFEESGPWRGCLDADESKAAKDWTLTGYLERDGERIALDEPILMLSGLLMFPDRLAIWDAGPVFPLLETLFREGPLKIPFTDRDAFLQLWYQMPEVPQVDLPAALQPETIFSTCRGRLEVLSKHSPARNKFAARVDFLYGEFRVPWYSSQGGGYQGQNRVALRRDPEHEALLMEELEAAGVQMLAEKKWRGDFSHAVDMHQLPAVVQQLMASGWEVYAEGASLRRPGQFQWRVSSGEDWFELNVDVEYGDTKASLPELLAAARRGDRFVKLDDGTRGMLPEEWLDRFAPMARLADRDDQDEAVDGLRFKRSQGLLLDTLLAEQDSVDADQTFRAFRKRVGSFAGVKPGPAPRGFQGNLRPYQKDGLGWFRFLQDFGFGGCLADDMGLGKTIQVLAMLQSRKMGRPKRGEARLPSIVVVPKSLVFNWLDEARKFTPRLRLLNYTGLDRHPRLEEAGTDYDLLVTTYGTLRRDIVALRELPFDYAILDESQAIKNPKAQASKAVRLLQSQHRLAMTGTPVENHLGELWSLFEFLNPGLLGSLPAFTDLIRADENGENVESARQLAASLRPFILRRTKSQVLKELPAKTEQTLYCEMSNKQRKQYDELREHYRIQLDKRIQKDGLQKSKIHVLEALLRLRQAACHPGLIDPARKDESSAKLDTLLEQIEEVIAEGHKVLVFSQFTSLLGILRGHLDTRKIRYAYLDGATQARQAEVDRFQTDEACPLFLISLKAGGFGLNLTAAEYVFILDPWWNPAVEAQAIDRAHRIGQDRHVFAYRLICRDTVEEKILKLQESKRELAEAIISEKNSLIRQLSAEDLKMLLG